MAGLLLAGNTTADHIKVLGWAAESLPTHYRPDPDNPDAPQILIRCDSAGATYGCGGLPQGRGGIFPGLRDAPIHEAAETLITKRGLVSNA